MLDENKSIESKEKIFLISKYKAKDKKDLKSEKKCKRYSRYVRVDQYSSNKKLRKRIRKTAGRQKKNQRNNRRIISLRLKQIRRWKWSNRFLK